MRTVTVSVPDTPGAEAAVRVLADQLNAGYEVLIVPIPPAAPQQAVAAVAAEAMAKLSVAAMFAAREN